MNATTPSRLITAALLCGAALAGPAQGQGRPVVTDIAWPGIDSYCTFMREGHSFDYNDPESWRFVFFSQLDTSAEQAVETAFMSIGYGLRQLELVDSSQSGNEETRRYRSLGAGSHDIVVTMVSGEEGYESTGYTGSIVVSGPLGEETVTFHGDCGV